MTAKAKQTKCRECGGAMKRRALTRTIQVGSRKVTDSSTMTPVCERCGAYELTHATRLRSERRAALTVLSDAPVIDGSVLRYARKALGLTQAQLAHALDAKHETISRWETGELTIARTTQLAVAQLLTMTEQDPEGFGRLIDGDEERISRTG